MRKSEALKYRNHIEEAVQALSDDNGLEVTSLYPLWAAGQEYTAGYKVQRGGKLCRCTQSHTSQKGWEPETAVSLWEYINEEHAGDLYDPIPYEGNMALEEGMHYSQKGVVYLCTRDTGNPVHNDLSELVGLYVETT